MARIATYATLIVIFIANLSSCALFRNNQEENRQAICKELNRQIVNNGATANQTLATQQRAETDILSKDYRTEGCETS